MSSGLLTSYITWKTTDGVYDKFNSFWFIVSRYTRLTPSLVTAMCLTLFLPLMGSGPLWNEFVAPVGKNCEKNWWVNLLYIQTFYKPDEMVSSVQWIGQFLEIILVINLTLSFFTNQVFTNNLVVI